MKQFIIPGLPGRGKITKEQFDFLDRVGVGQESIEDMDLDDLRHLRDCLRAMVNVFPFKLVRGMEDMV